jgi:hypothetical protein
VFRVVEILNRLAVRAQEVNIVIVHVATLICPHVKLPSGIFYSAVLPAVDVEVW